MTTVAAPRWRAANPDDFRVEHGRYKERWYFESLPACDLAPGPMAEPVPSVSAVKNAYPKFFDNVTAEAVARCAVEEQHIWRAMPDAKQQIGWLAGAKKRMLDNRADEGSAAHHIIEALIEGREPNELDVVAAGPYVNSCRQLVADVQPQPVVAEVVVISRTYGYGGTLDALWVVDGQLALIDFKTRKPGKHGAYGSEGAQLGAYATADYMLVLGDDGRPRRERIPEIEAAYIFSICPDDDGADRG